MLNIRKKWDREKRDFKENYLVIMNINCSLWSFGKIISVNKGINKTSKHFMLLERM